MAAEFIGAGPTFPLGTDPTGSVALVEGEDKIAQSVRLILGTAYGERPMRPEFGCGIHDLLFAPANADTAGRVAYEVRRSLQRWEPRIDLREVRVDVDDDRPGVLYVRLTYTIRGEDDPRNLVFPFYSLPSEE